MLSTTYTCYMDCSYFAQWVAKSKWDDSATELDHTSYWVPVVRARHITAASVQPAFAIAPTPLVASHGMGALDYARSLTSIDTSGLFTHLNGPGFQRARLGGNTAENVAPR